MEESQNKRNRPNRRLQQPTPWSLMCDRIRQMDVNRKNQNQLLLRGAAALVDISAKRHKQNLDIANSTSI